MSDYWTRSTTEELLAGVYAIGAILCFGYGFTVFGWAFAIKAAIDTLLSLAFAIREYRRASA